MSIHRHHHRHHTHRNQPPHRHRHYSPKVTDTGQSVRAMSSGFEPVLSGLPSKQVTSVASISINTADDDDDDEESLEFHRVRGAIPKRRVTVDQSVVRRADSRKCLNESRKMYGAFL